MKVIKLFVFCMLVCVSGMAQGKKSDGYKIEVSINGLTDSTIYLANYFGKKLYYADTAMVDKKGNAVFEGEKAFKGGKYAIVIPGPKLFDILLEEQHFKVTTDTTDLVRNIDFEGSINNTLYYDYIKFIASQKDRIAKLRADIEGISSDEAERSPEEGKKYKKTSEEMKEIDKEVTSYQEKLLTDNKGSLATTIVGMTIPVKIPDPPKDEDGNITDSLFQFHYYVKHYFDNTPLSDYRITRSPEYDKKLIDYFTKALPQSPDTLIHHADMLIPQVSHDSDLFKLTLHTITYNFQSSKYMGMDKAYVHMIENYYTKGGINWLDSAKLADVIDEALAMKPTLIGQKAPFFRLHDTTATKFTNLYEIVSEYTLIYIWAPDCGHCKKTNPKLLEFNEKYKDLVKVMAISAHFENDEWLEYLSEHPEFHVLLNLSDSPEYPSPFRSLYNSITTPTILLLDREKKIIAKKLDMEQLGEFMERKILQDKSQ